MTDIPIIFSAPMVRALLREADEFGTGMTRRLRWRDERDAKKMKFIPFEIKKPLWANPRLCIFDEPRGGCHYPIPTPWWRVKPGDRLWVRENAWFPEGRKNPNGHVTYQADHGIDRALKWTPSIHMPRWASRLTLIVTATKIERLQEITEQDCEREGCRWYSHSKSWAVEDVPVGVLTSYIVEADTARGCFEGLWRHLHSDDAWDANPEVVALTFRVVRANIDSAEARAA